MFLQLLPHLFTIFVVLIVCIVFLTIIIKRRLHDDEIADVLWLPDWFSMLVIIILGSYMVYKESVITNSILLKDEQKDCRECETR